MGASELEFAYGHWGTAIFNSIIWLALALQLLWPLRKSLEWLGFVLFSAFIIEGYLELYVAPYSLNLIANHWGHYQAVDLLGHRSGDLWRVIFHLNDRDEDMDVFHLLGGVGLFGGMALMAYAWWVARQAREREYFADTGPYAVIRHPQYMALIIVMVGGLIQAPTFPTLTLFPVITGLYLYMARQEDRELASQFGYSYRKYMYKTPAFIPAWERPAK